MTQPKLKSPWDSLIEFIGVAGRLKSTPRTGWLDRGLPPDRVESVADHTFRVALMAWVLAKRDPSLDRSRVLELALLHDLPEALTGDKTPYDLPPGEPSEQRRVFLEQRHVPDPARRERKRVAEANAIGVMTEALAPLPKEEVRELWSELSDQSSAEARFVKQIDKLETYLQSIEYRAAMTDLPIASFAAEVQEVIDIPLLIELRDAIANTFGPSRE